MYLCEFLENRFSGHSTFVLSTTNTYKNKYDPSGQEMRLSLIIALMWITSPISLNIIIFSTFKLTVSMGQTVGQADGRSVTIEILIKFLGAMPQISSVATNVIKLPFQKLADTSKDELLLGGGIFHVTVCCGITRTVNKFLLA